MLRLEEAKKLFSNIKTLSVIEIPADRLLRAFNWKDKNYPESFLQKFISLNNKTLDFLGITASINQNNYKFSLVLSTSNNIGVAPIYSPSTGKPVFDIIISGRYNGEVGELMSLLGDSIQPEYSDTLLLTSKTSQKPPLYLESCRFIDKYIEAQRYKWQKFTSDIKTQKAANGGTFWDKYALSTACNPLAFNVFVNRCNTLTTNHNEWNKLNYVLVLAINILSSKQAPIRVKFSYAEKIKLLKRNLEELKTQETNRLSIKASDPAVIKDLKLIGNILLDEETNQSLAWRMDYALFFERFVQYLFNDVSKKKNGTAFCNKHYSIYGDKPKWALSYLEPDIVVQKDDVQFIIDAKYKSHVLNWREYSDDLKEEFRHDLHQVLAYSSFSRQENKHVILAYPSSSFVKHKITIKTPLNATETTLFIVGIPLEKSQIEESKKQLSGIITFESTTTH